MSATITGISHRFDAVHRLQSLRSSVQGMERPCRRWLELVGQFLRQHRRAGALHLAACEVRGSTRREPGLGGNDGRHHCRGNFLPTCASIAKTPGAWKLAPPARSCAPNSAASLCSPTSATAAATAWSPARSAWCSAIREDGRAFKCTFCYDRQKVGTEARLRASLSDGVDQVRPAESTCVLVAQERVQELQSRGMDDAQLYDPQGTSVGGIHAVFIVRGDPRQYNLPPKPEVPTIYLKAGWTGSAVAAGLLLVGSIFAFLGSGRTMSEFAQQPTPSIRIDRANSAYWRFAARRRSKAVSRPSGVRPRRRAVSDGIACNRLLRHSITEAAAVDAGRSRSLLLRWGSRGLGRGNRC